MIKPKLPPDPNALFSAKEFKVIALRESPIPSTMRLLDTPEAVATYFREVVTGGPYYKPEVESFAVLMVNCRRRINGFHVVANGTLDCVQVHPREVFRGPIIANAAAVILIHNHPSGDPTPSESDIKVTRDLIRAGQVMKIEVLDHVIMGTPDPAGNARGWVSLRELGYF